MVGKLYRIRLNTCHCSGFYIREIYLAISSFTYNNIFSESIGELVINNWHNKLLVVDLEKVEV